MKEKDEAVIRCTNTVRCDAQNLGGLIHFVSKKSLNIEGLGEKQINQFYKLGFIKNFEDIFYINRHKNIILDLEGWGELSFQNLIKSIEKSKSIALDNFITSQDNYQNHLSPGRKRLVSNYKSSDIEWDFNQDTSNEENMKKGDRVFHQKFGYGKILFIEGDKAKVDFEKSSQKQVFVKYLQFMN